MSTPFQGRIAPIPRRVLACVIDAAIGFGIGAVIPVLLLVMTLLVTGSPRTALIVAGPLLLLLAGGWFVVLTAMQGGRGSIGMRAQGLRLADAATGAPIGFGRALLRNIIWGLAGAIVVGCFSPLFDGTGRFQGWHDRVGSALVLDARGETADAPPQPSAAVTGPLPTTAVPAVLPPAAEPGHAVPGHAPVPVTAAPAASDPPQAAPAPAPVADELDEQTVLAPRAGRETADASVISFVPGVTQDQAPQRAVPEAPAAPAPAVPEPVAPTPAPVQPEPETPTAPVTTASADPDDDIESTRISIPGHRLILTWDDGQRATVSGRTVFGRNPDPEAGAAVVAVRDETLSLSKTHFEAGAAASGGWVMDRQSTNGTIVVRDGLRIACPPGQRVPIRLGDALEIGDRIVTIGGYA